MPRLSLAERARVAVLSADRSRRMALSRALNSPLMRWRYGSPVADQLLIVPQDLRTADPSFWREVRLGQFGLAGSIALLKGYSPFDIDPPSQAWDRALNGFGWLRHLNAAESDDARAEARELVLEWIGRNRSIGARTAAWEPAVTARRLIAWISHAGLLLEGVDQRVYQQIAESLGLQHVHHSATWRDAPAGYPRLLALTALVLANLSIAGHDRQLVEAERLFAAEITRQILPDGGHVSRNPAVLVEVLLDFLPLGQCFAARSRTPPEAFTKSIQRMLTMLRTMRLGDGMLARFNGNGVAFPAGLATVLAYDDLAAPKQKTPSPSGYARLERGETVVIVDVGSPPPLEYAAEAHAGCLSFELTIGSRPMFLNGGAPGHADHDWRPASRGTASHNTLSLGDKSSSKLVWHRGLNDLIGGLPIRFPDRVVAKLSEDDGNQTLEAWHDGYLKRFGLIHRRRLKLYDGGRRMEGVDRLGPTAGKMRLKQDLPFSIHFHLHPDVMCRYGRTPGTAEIVPVEGSTWRFSAAGAELVVEESVHFAGSAGPRAGLQIVLRGATFGETEVTWVFEATA